MTVEEKIKELRSIVDTFGGDPENYGMNISEAFDALAAMLRLAVEQRDAKTLGIYNIVKATQTEHHTNITINLPMEDALSMMNAALLAAAKEVTE